MSSVSFCFFDNIQCRKKYIFINLIVLKRDFQWCMTSFNLPFEIWKFTILADSILPGQIYFYWLEVSVKLIECSFRFFKHSNDFRDRRTEIKHFEDSTKSKYIVSRYTNKCISEIILVFRSTISFDDVLAWQRIEQFLEYTLAKIALVTGSDL